MKTDKHPLIDTFAELGLRLSGFGQDEHSTAVMMAAERDNPWFRPHDIVCAIEALRENMLDRDALTNWLLSYPTVTNPKSIGVIMAGNIPLVGFHDLLCVVISGHECFIKPSSKDSALMEYIVSLLKDIDPDIPIYTLDKQPIDAVIATGSDNTNRYFRSRYGTLPSLLRGSRTSIAALTGSESREMLLNLTSDIFSYSGLGCRNVSHILLPHDYDTDTLAAMLSEYRDINPKYVNNYRQRKAILDMTDLVYTDGDFFILRESIELPSSISEITYRRYNEVSEAHKLLTDIDQHIQCVVCDAGGPFANHSRSVVFGFSQSPGLCDYPDGADIMSFLRSV